MSSPNNTTEIAHEKGNLVTMPTHDDEKIAQIVVIDQEEKAILRKIDMQ
jgi:hypothetical protein